MKTRRVIALLVAILTLVTATASAEWFYAGLDTRDVDNIGRFYNEQINGDYTGKVKFVPFTLEEYLTLVDWEFESYEFDYPHAGYERLYVDGKAQGNTRYNGSYPQWETKFADYIWEIANESIVVTDPVDGQKEYTGHRIWQRQMTKIPGYGWVWDFGKTPAEDARVYVPTERMADVTESYKITGFANLKPNGEKLFEITEDKQLLDPAIRAQYNAINLYKDFDRFSTIEEAFPTYDWDNFVVTSGLFTDESLSEIDPVTGEYVVTDLMIKKALAPYSVATKWLDGPSLNGEDGVKDVASLYIEDLKHNAVTNITFSDDTMWKWEDGSVDWKWDTDTVANGIPVYEYVLACGHPECAMVGCPACERAKKLVDYKNITIDWTAPDYEFTTPYAYYQCLIVNGIVMDGTKDTPRIIRHTGGKAQPKVEWKYTPFTEVRAAYEAIGVAVDYIPEEVCVDQVVEWMYVDGKAAYYDDGTPVLRVPTGEYAKCYIKVTDSHVELWRETVYGEELALQYQIQEAPGGYYNYSAPGAVNVVRP